MSTKVHTYKNTSFQEWRDMVMLEFSKRDMLPLELHPKRHLHGYEAGDTPYSWVDFLIRQEGLQKRTRDMKRDNPGIRA
jgi:hypothetical protein